MTPRRSVCQGGGLLDIWTFISCDTYVWVSNGPDLQVTNLPTSYKNGNFVHYTLKNKTCQAAPGNMTASHGLQAHSSAPSATRSTSAPSGTTRCAATPPLMRTRPCQLQKIARLPCYAALQKNALAYDKPRLQSLVVRSQVQLLLNSISISVQKRQRRVLCSSRVKLELGDVWRGKLQGK